jgi:hypothetical protein
MKELLAVNTNFIALWDEKQKLHPNVEIILILSEPSYNIDPCGQVIRQRETHQVRFSASPSLLRKLCDSLQKLADEAETLPLENNSSK